MGLNSSTTDREEVFGGIAFVFVAICVALVVVYVAVYDEVAVGSSVYVDSDSKNTNLDLLTENNPVLNFWTLKNKKEKTYFVVNSYVDQQINDIIEIIKQNKPSYFEKNSEEDLRNLIRLNLMQ